MSGPKVVRIVTREEILEICEGALARVDAALAEWVRVGRRNDCVDEEAIATATRRREALARLIATDRFMDLQKQAPVEEQFLRDDLQRRLADVAARQSAARSRERRGRQAGETLLRRLRETGTPVSPEVLARLESGDAEALSTGFGLLADASAPRAASKLAASLRDDRPVATLEDWLSTQPAPPVDPAVERIAVRIDEIEATGETGSATWRSRLTEAETADGARRGLLIDGLEVETGKALTETRRRVALRSELDALRAELSAAGAAPGEVDPTAMDAQALERQVAKTRQVIETLRAERAAAARRAAVLQGLAELGYEVTEGMTTSFAREGRLVVRSAARPDYGVEVNTPAGREQMQMRPVAFDVGGVGPDPSRDRDAETIWCGDVSTLQDALAAAGGGLAIERALPVGATPLKRIAVDGPTPDGAAVHAPAPRERSLR